MFNNFGFLWFLDDYITYYKLNVVDVLFNEYKNKKLSYDDFYISKEQRIYFNLIKYYNQVYFYNKSIYH